MAAAIGEPVDILGHSFGAACVLGAARLIPNLCRMLLYEPPMLQEQQSLQRAMLLDNMEQLLAHGENAQVIITLLRDMLNIPQPMIDRIRPCPTGPIRWRRRTPFRANCVRVTATHPT